jgi:hypothetical protein
MNEEGPVRFEHQEPNGLGQLRRQAPRVQNPAASNDQSHGAQTVLSFSDGVGPT